MRKITLHQINENNYINIAHPNFVDKYKGAIRYFHPYEYLFVDNLPRKHSIVDDVGNIRPDINLLLKFYIRKLRNRPGTVNLNTPPYCSSIYNSIPALSASVVNYESIHGNVAYEKCSNPNVNDCFESVCILKSHYSDGEQRNKLKCFNCYINKGNSVGYKQVSNESKFNIGLISIPSLRIRNSYFEGTRLRRKFDHDKSLLDEDEVVTNFKGLLKNSGIQGRMKRLNNDMLQLLLSFTFVPMTCMDRVGYPSGAFDIIDDRSAVSGRSDTYWYIRAFTHFFSKLIKLDEVKIDNRASYIEKSIYEVANLMLNGKDDFNENLESIGYFPCSKSDILDLNDNKNIGIFNARVEYASEHKITIHGSYEHKIIERASKEIIKLMSIDDVKKKLMGIFSLTVDLQYAHVFRNANGRMSQVIRDSFSLLYNESLFPMLTSMSHYINPISGIDEEHFTFMQNMFSNALEKIELGSKELSSIMLLSVNDVATELNRNRYNKSILLDICMYQYERDMLISS
ncbi:hypothetical protein [uncultured Vibrio sp.]|uniref:hypothetical protein n=1 Tax=uncultured Vibrio sp. TaxID=114054 RepID=UPI0026390DD1|nr:hypothetical protein [uncultured Vibrio sp.]